MDIKRDYQDHTPVLLREVVDFLDVGSGKRYIDATVGGGGHTCAIISKGGIVLGLDQDPGSLEIAQRRLEARFDESPGVFTLVRSNFSKIKEVANVHGFSALDGVLFDLGFASFQVEDASRGLSFMKDGPLDMRLDPRLGVTAADLVNSLPERQLVQLFQEYGEEPKSKTIARAIVSARRREPFQTTKQLADLIQSVVHVGYKRRIHPATRVFQALRIAVNSELESVKEGLVGAFELLKPGGRMAVITFHSGEDRIVKDQFREWSDRKLATLLTKKPIVPTEQESRENPRSRSAKLRVVERLPRRETRNDNNDKTAICEI